MYKRQDRGRLGGRQLLQPHTVEDMTSAHLTEAQRARYRAFNSGDELGYSYGYMVRVMPVSYTHLDVYKRQPPS